LFLIDWTNQGLGKKLKIARRLASIGFKANHLLKVAS